MATKKKVVPARQSRKKASRAAKPRRSGARRPAPRLVPVRGATIREVGGVRLEVGPAGSGRVKRLVYPSGFRWSTDMKPIVGTELCMHAHVGFLEQGQIHIQYADGCVVEFRAPQVVAIEPGHDGWVVGRVPAVMIEFDFGRDTGKRFGMSAPHRH